MKKIIILLIFFSVSELFAQSGWQVQYHHETYEELFDLFFINDNTGWCSDASLYGKILKTTNKGINWNILSDSLYSVTGICFKNENTGWYSATSGELSKTTNGGFNWIYSQFCNCSTADDFRNIQFINENTGWAFGDLQVFKTTDGGLNYHVQTYYYGGVFNGMFIDSSNGWVAGESGTGRTTNGGLNWIRNDIPGSSYCYDIFFADINTGWVCTYSGKIYKSTNGGDNWSPQQSGVSTTLNKIQFIDVNTGWIIGKAGKILKTTNGGINWLSQASLEQNNLWGIYMINAQEGWICGQRYIFYTTDGGGPTVGIEPISSVVPENYSLHQNYPNPFNPTTKINYELPNSNFVSLKVYDVLGNEVETLVNRMQNAGSYSVTFDAATKPSGVYFYKLVTDGFSETKKMVVVK